VDTRPADRLTKHRHTSDTASTPSFGQQPTTRDTPSQMVQDVQLHHTAPSQVKHALFGYNQLVATQHVPADCLVQKQNAPSNSSGGAIPDSIKEGQSSPWLVRVVFAACHHVPFCMFLASKSILTTGWSAGSKEILATYMAASERALLPRRCCQPTCATARAPQNPWVPRPVWFVTMARAQSACSASNCL